jgi:hypothetical protein
MERYVDFVNGYGFFITPRLELNAILQMARKRNITILYETYHDIHHRIPLEYGFILSITQGNIEPNKI